jgi:hypothetical protein
MGSLTAPGLLALIEAGCQGCGGKKLDFRTYVDARQRLLAGEPDGLTWAYKGETFIDGVYEVSCAACKKGLFSSSICPRCHAEGGLAAALAREGGFAAPKECPGCQAEELVMLAMVPARVTYEGKRAEKARTTTELSEPGFHGYELSCRFCGVVAAQEERCPLCDAPGPLRPRPD